MEIDLKQARKRAGYTRKQPAERLQGLRRKNLAQNASGARNPSKERASAFRALNLGYSYAKTGEPYL